MANEVLHVKSSVKCYVNAKNNVVDLLLATILFHELDACK